LSSRIGRPHGYYSRFDRDIAGVWLSVVWGPPACSGNYGHPPVSPDLLATLFAWNFAPRKRRRPLAPCVST
jgi:hypothetical protein